MPGDRDVANRATFKKRPRKDSGGIHLPHLGTRTRDVRPGPEEEVAGPVTTDP